MNSLYGNKGFIFSVDIAIGLVIVASIIAMSSAYMLSSGKSGISEIALRKTGSDIIAVMDYEGILATYNRTAIEGNLSSLVPFNMNMSMVISRHATNGNFLDRLQIGADLKKNYYSGRWMLVSFDGKAASNFYIVEYKVGFR